MDEEKAAYRREHTLALVVLTALVAIVAIVAITREGDVTVKICMGIGALVASMGAGAAIRLRGR